MSYQSVNPYDGKLVRSFPEMSNDQLETAMATASRCFATWRSKSYSERALIVRKAAELMHSHIDDFARVATVEMGKRIGEARGEVEFASRILAYYSQNAELTTIAVPAVALPVYAVAPTSVMVHSIEKFEDFDALLDDRRYSGWLIGPGAGVGEQTRARRASDRSTHGASARMRLPPSRMIRNRCSGRSWALRAHATRWRVR